MSVMTKEQVFEAARQLSPAEQIELAEQLMEAERPFTLTDEQKTEVLAELQAYDDNPKDVVVWEDVKAELRQKLNR